MARQLPTLSDRDRIAAADYAARKLRDRLELLTTNLFLGRPAGSPALYRVWHHTGRGVVVELCEPYRRTT